MLDRLKLGLLPVAFPGGKIKGKIKGRLRGREPFWDIFMGKKRRLRKKIKGSRRLKKIKGSGAFLGYFYGKKGSRPLLLAPLCWRCS
jgi:hypothetical protein